MEDINYKYHTTKKPVQNKAYCVDVRVIAGVLCIKYTTYFADHRSVKFASRAVDCMARTT